MKGKRLIKNLMAIIVALIIIMSLCPLVSLINSSGVTTYADDSETTTTTTTTTVSAFPEGKSEDKNIVYLDLSLASISIGDKYITGSFYYDGVVCSFQDNSNADKIKTANNVVQTSYDVTYTIKQDDGSTKEVTVTYYAGTHSTSNYYYIYQSNGDTSYGYFSATTVNGKEVPAHWNLPEYTTVKYNGESWGEDNDGESWADYITNNNDVSDVVSAWDDAFSSRKVTNNEICISGESDFNVLIDNIYANHTTKYNSTYSNYVCDFGKVGSSCGPISVRDIGKKKVTLYLKGDNRIRNIYYSHPTKDTGGLVITSYKGSESTEGTLTVADLSNTTHVYGLGVISPYDEDEYGLTFSGGTVFAGIKAQNHNVWSTSTSFMFPVCVGGGFSPYKQRHVGQVIVTSGNLTAVSNGTSPALGGGGGYTGESGKGLIDISGGNVYAYAIGVYSGVLGKVGYVSTVAIGGASTFEGDAESGTVVNISGGYVYAESLGGAAIGGGSSINGTGGDATINISGKDTKVEAVSSAGRVACKTSSSGTGAGTGAGGSSKVTDYMDVSAGTAIGGGTGVTGGDATINVKDGTITAYSRTFKVSEEGKIVYEEGEIVYTTTYGTIGGGTASTGNGGSATVEVSGGTLIADSIGGGVANGSVTTSETINETTSITEDGNITKSIIDSTIDSKETPGNGGSATVIVSGGTLTATTIGGGASYRGNGGSATVTVNGGTLNATTIGGGTAYGSSFSYKQTETIVTTTTTVTIDEVSGESISTDDVETETKTLKETDVLGNGGSATLIVTGGTLNATTIGGGTASTGNGGSATVTVEGGTLNANSIGGGTGGSSGNGGSAKITITDGTIVTGIIGAGTTISEKEDNYIGYATATISGGDIVGQFILKGNGNDETKCTFTMTGGTIHDVGYNVTYNNKTYSNRQKNGGAIWMDDPNGEVTISGGTIENCSAVNGGAVYMTAGTFTLKDRVITDENGEVIKDENGNETKIQGVIKNCSATDRGGAVDVEGGQVKILGGEISGCKAKNGGAMYVSGLDKTIEDSSVTITSNADVKPDDYTVYIKGGTITGNTATQNGGAICVNNGHVLVDGGEISSNKASGTYNDGETVTGMGGGIYLSSSARAEAIVRMRSGSIINNTAKTSGAAIAIAGDNNVVLKVTIGVNMEHNKDKNGNYINEADHTNEKIDTSCPVISGNLSEVSGGAIYISGGESDILNIYCIIEEKNTTNGDEQLSNFLMVEGGAVIISTGSKITDSTDGEGTKFDNDNGNDGCSTITGTIHIIAGTLDIYGTMQNPEIDAVITVEIKDKSDHFEDHRINAEGADPIYWIHYYENFTDSNGNTSGTYKAYPVMEDTLYSQMIEAVVYSHEGYIIDGWNTKADGTGNSYVVGTTYKFYVETKYDDDGKVIIQGNEDLECERVTVGDLVGDGSILQLYAVWKASYYIVRFDANVPAGAEYSGTMADQTFNVYVSDSDEGTALTANAYRYMGYSFSGWSTTANGTVKYADEQKVKKLSSEQGAVVRLYAVWVICTHGTDKTYTYSADENKIIATCECLTYTEIVGMLVAPTDNVYTGKAIEATYTVLIADHQPTSVTIKYKQNNAEISGSPVDSGTYNTTDGYKQYTYTAYIELDNGDAELDYVIERATRNDTPNKPTYDVKDGVVTISPANSSIDTTEPEYEYRLSFYITEDSNVTLANIDWTSKYSITLEYEYTTYFVYIRYSETGNYYASDSVQADNNFYFWEKDINVIINVVSDDGIVYYFTNIKNAPLGVQLNVSVDSGYYLLSTYSFTINTEKNSTDDVTVAVMKEDSTVPYQYTVTNISNNSTITITLTGARKIASVTSQIVEGQEFGAVGGSSCVIAYNSSFTVAYTVQRYNNYKDLAINFNKALPNGTTIILLDRDSKTLAERYWYYIVGEDGATQIVGEDGTTQIPLSSFTLMGGSAKFATATPTKADGATGYSNNTLRYQFIINFASAEQYSGEETTPNLEVWLTASGIKERDITESDKQTEGYDLGTNQETSDLETSKLTITFKGLTFEIGVADKEITKVETVENEDSDESDDIAQISETDETTETETTDTKIYDTLSKVLTITFAKADKNTDTAEWDDRAGVLVLTANEGTTLPSDAHFEVESNGYIAEYYATTLGTCVIPVDRDEKITITLASERFASETKYSFTAYLYSSLSEATTAYNNGIVKASTTLKFTSPVATVLPSLKVTTENRLCELKGTLEVTLQSMNMDGYTVKGTVYRRSGDLTSGYTYTSTGQVYNKIEISTPEDGGISTTKLSVGLAAYNSGNYCVKFEVIDSSGNTLYKIPIYFIIQDNSTNTDTDVVVDVENSADT